MPDERTEEFFDTISSKGDALRFRMTRSGHDVLAFVVPYEIWVDDEWRPIVRYDTAHRRPHRDTLGWRGEVVEKQWFPEAINYNDALAIAANEVRRQWKVFRDEFFRRKP
jgi:hypothetical protein